jgi:hypothetical protein
MKKRGKKKKKKKKKKQSRPRLFFRIFWCGGWVFRARPPPPGSAASKKRGRAQAGSHRLCPQFKAKFGPSLARAGCPRGGACGGPPARHPRARPHPIRCFNPPCRDGALRARFPLPLRDPLSPPPFFIFFFFFSLVFFFFLSRNFTPSPVKLVAVPVGRGWRAAGCRAPVVGQVEIADPLAHHHLARQGGLLRGPRQPAGCRVIFFFFFFAESKSGVFSLV